MPRPVIEAKGGMEFGTYIAVDAILLFLSLGLLVVGSFALRNRTGRCFWAVGILGLVAWGPLYYWIWGLSGSPQRAARNLLLAAQKGDCPAVWSSFSHQARRRIAAQSNASRVELDHRYCRPGNVFHRYEPSSVRISKPGENIVVVSVRAVSGYLLPGGFWRLYTDRELTLVREAGEWKVETVPVRP